MAYVQHYCGPISAKMLRTLSLIVFVVLVMKIELIASSNVSTEAIQNSTQTTTIAPAVRAATLNVTKKSKQDEVDILPPHYYRDVAPMTKDRKPVKVTVSLVILNIKLSQGSSQVQSHCLNLFFSFCLTPGWDRPLMRTCSITTTGRTTVCRSHRMKTPLPSESICPRRNRCRSTSWATVGANVSGHRTPTFEMPLREASRTFWRLHTTSPSPTTLKCSWRFAFRWSFHAKWTLSSFPLMSKSASSTYQWVRLLINAKVIVVNFLAFFSIRRHKYRNSRVGHVQSRLTCWSNGVSSNFSR